MPITFEGATEREFQFLQGDTLQILFFNGSFTPDSDLAYRDAVADEVGRKDIDNTPGTGNVTITYNATTDELEHTIIETFTVTTGFSYNRYGLMKGSAVPDEGSPAIACTFTSTTTADLGVPPATVNLAVGDRVVQGGAESVISIGGITGNVITVDDPIFPASGSGTVYNGTGILLFIKEVNPSQSVPNGGDINFSQTGSSVSTC